jgi:hypothetical protein
MKKEKKEAKKRNFKRKEEKEAEWDARHNYLGHTKSSESFKKKNTEASYSRFYFIKCSK